YYYTSGYPYLVSKLCKFIDEAIVPARNNPNWSVDDVDEAFNRIVDDSYTTTLFDSTIKNLENDPELYDTIFQIVMNGAPMRFTIADPLISRGHLYGILKESEGQCRVHNRIYEQRIYAYMLSKSLRMKLSEFSAMETYEFSDADDLNVPLILQKFQTVMKEQYSHKDKTFLEREGRLLFLAFLKPIIHGKGFEFKEPNVAEERRMDVVIAYGNQRYVIELKRWKGDKAHQDGLQQLSDYLDMYSLKQGYLLIYDFNKGKEYKQKQIAFQDKQIFAVWV
ncbi:MAG: AAA family ATPase, partial [bacterium]|nr:AAA family ATPase [bacterium]